MGLLSAMYEDDADFTNTFRALGSITSQPADGEEDGVPAPLLQVRSSARCRLSCALLNVCVCVGCRVELCPLALDTCPTCSSRGPGGGSRILRHQLSKAAAGLCGIGLPVPGHADQAAGRQLHCTIAPLFSDNFCSD